MPVVADDFVAEADIDDVGFGVGFTQLSTCKKVPKDNWPEVTDVKSWVGAYLKDANGRHNERIAQFVNERLPEAAKGVLISYMR